MDQATTTMKTFFVVLLFALWSNKALAAAAASTSVLLSNLKSFTAGGVGGVLSVLVGHPLDLVKVRMQAASSKAAGSKVGDTRQVGTLRMLGDILRAEGVAGLYRGVGAPILAVAPIWAISFWGFDAGIKMVRFAAGGDPTAALTIPQLCAAGAFSALPTALVMVPSERIKCILQMQDATADKKKRRYKGMGDCAAHIYRESGLRGLYKGTALTLLRDVPSNMVYFGVYEVVKQSIMAKTTAAAAAAGSPTTLAALTAGAMAGIAFWPVALPMDTLKTRYQTAEEGHYKSMVDVYREVVREDGAGGLFKGIGPAMVRSAPANSVSFLGAEVTKKVLSFVA